MKWHLATNQQLETIVKYEYNCPHSLLSGAVVEMLNRNLFDKIICDAIKKVLNIEAVEKYHKISLDDFLQIGRLEIFNVIDNFNPTKSKNFISFAYMAVKHQIIKYLVTLEAEKRDNRKVMSYQNKTAGGEEFEIFFRDTKTNVEKYVVNKVTLEQLLKRINKHQSTVIYYRLQGYTFKEISEMLGRGNDRTMHQAYRLAVEKMRKGA